MAISEERRHHLYQRLEQVLGSEEAATLMEHLPAVGWADVATRRDIDDLRVSTGRGIEALRRDIGHIEGRLNHMEGHLERMDGHLERFDSRFDHVRSDIRTTMLAVMSMMVVLFGAVVAVVKL